MTGTSTTTLPDIESLRQRIDELEQANASLVVSESRYRDLVENARDMIWTVDLTGNVTFLNSACQHITGYTKEELLGKELADLAPPNSLEAAREALSRKWKNERDTSFEIRIVAKNGRLVDLEVNSAILERSGAPAVVLAIARDVSERKVLQEQLQQSNRLEAVGRLAGGVAHDFNNLLTVIFGYSQLLLNRVDTGHSMHTGLDQIRQSAERAAILTRQLLAFSRKQPLEPAILDLSTLVTDMQKLLRRLIGEHIDLVTTYSPDPCLISADPSQIEQIVMNLALNARDAMPGGGTLTIETTRMQLTPQNAGAYPPGAYAMLRVIDTGADIDKVTRTHLFDPFFTTQRHDNSGLGLSAVYGMVEQHGGFVRVSSAPGAGATFDVCLPLHQAGQDPRESADPESTALSGSETILVVEDEAGVRTLIAETLSVYGYSVIEAGDSSAALDLAQQENSEIDLLLTDIVMPKINGRNLADAWMLLHPEVKVLFISGYTGSAPAADLVDDLGDRLLQKPFSGAKLARKVREALDAAAS